MSDAFELSVRAASSTYNVRVEAGALPAWLADHEDAYAIVDERFASLPGLVAERTVTVPAIEDQKTLAGTERVLIALRQAGARRGDRLVAVGGGILQDVATLAAQLYMRGLPWAYAPTTLLAMADSCIGGKSSINVGAYKNLVGSFHPPGDVIVDTDFLDTLPEIDRAGGMAEAMKITYCRGPEAFARYTDLRSGFPATAGPLVAHALECKRWFIEIDEFDQAERRLLNLGHTFGHALEAATDYRVPHGIAVAIGVLAAERFAVVGDHGPGDPALAAEAAGLARLADGLPGRVTGLSRPTFERAFTADKKHGADGLHVILPTGGGGVGEIVVPDRARGMATAHVALTQALATVTE